MTMYNKIVKNNDGASSSQATEIGYSLANDPNASVFADRNHQGGGEF